MFSKGELWNRLTGGRRRAPGDEEQKGGPFKWGMDPKQWDHWWPCWTQHLQFTVQIMVVMLNMSSKNVTKATNPMKFLHGTNPVKKKKNSFACAFALILKWAHSKLSIKQIVFQVQRWCWVPAYRGNRVWVCICRFPLCPFFRDLLEEPDIQRDTEKLRASVFQEVIDDSNILGCLSAHSPESRGRRSAANRSVKENRSMFF